MSKEKKDFNIQYLDEFCGNFLVSMKIICELKLTQWIRSSLKL